MVHAIRACARSRMRCRSKYPKTAVCGILSPFAMVQDHVCTSITARARLVDVTSALNRPAKTSPRAVDFELRKSSATYFKGIQQGEGVVDSGQLSVFASGYWGHPAYALPPEVNLLRSHIISKRCSSRRISFAFTPSSGQESASAVVPRGRYVDGYGSNEPAAVINPETITLMRTLVAKAQKFVDDYYIPECSPSHGL